MECMWLWIYKFCPVISSYLLIEIYITISYNQSTHTISTHKQNWFSKRKADQNPELNKTPLLFHKLTKKTTQYLHGQFYEVENEKQIKLEDNQQSEDSGPPSINGCPNQNHNNFPHFFSLLPLFYYTLLTNFPIHHSKQPTRLPPSHLESSKISVNPTIVSWFTPLARAIYLILYTLTVGAVTQCNSSIPI